MKILVDARAVTRVRMVRAGAGLALRGHDVRWLGPRAAAVPRGAVATTRGALVSSAGCDVVIGCGDRAFPAASAGWLARSHALVLSLDPASVARWSVADRWAWQSLYASGLIEEAQADAMRREPGGLELERMALWSAEAPPAEDDAAHPDTEVLERACERALARQRSRAQRAAAFMDRDGTLVIERGYLSDPADLDLIAGVPAALRMMREAGLALIVISNQSGVGRGLFPLSRVYEAMARLRGLLRSHGIELDAIYFCPHRPEAGCDCRKPGTGLLERAAEDQNLALGRSCMFGDKLIDAATGRRAGGRGVLLRTGYGRDEERAVAAVAAAEAPDGVFEDLEAAARWWVHESAVSDPD